MASFKLLLVFGMLVAIFAVTQGSAFGGGRNQRGVGGPGGRGGFGGGFGGNQGGFGRNQGGFGGPGGFGPGFGR